MRSDRKKQQGEAKRSGSGGSSGFNIFTKIWGILFLLASVVFAGALVYADILPAKYLLIAALIILLFLAILFPTLMRKKGAKGTKVASLILSILLMILYGIGSRYLLGTMDFMSKVTNLGSTEEYYVVVRDDDVFFELADIEGETVYGHRTGKNYDGAVALLTNMVSVSIDEYSDISYLMDDLINGAINVSFVNSGVYDALEDEDENIADYTKIIETIKVSNEVADIRKPVEVKDSGFNICITGIDTKGTIDVVSRSDVNMVLTVNPSTHTILMTSIPRDYYVQLPDVESYDKLTHTGIYGADYTVSTIEKLLGVDLNYYVKVNFSTVEMLVDAIDGIEVESDYSFTTKKGGYYIEEGWNSLDGPMALAFARERYAFSDGDFQRNKNQQKVMKAIIDKMTGSTALLTNYSSILNSIEDYFETNMTREEIKTLVRMQTDDMASWDISSQSIKGTVSSESCYSIGGRYASVVLQDEASIAEAVSNIKAVMQGEFQGVTEESADSEEGE